MAADSAALAKHFSYFADHEVTSDPLYVALCRHVAARPDLLELMQHAPPTQRVPNLLLASVHDQVLAGVSHALREYVPSAGGTRPPDRDLPATFDDFIAAQREALCGLLATRSTQLWNTTGCTSGAKVDVNGGSAKPLWQWLKGEAPGLLGSQAIKWNFTKFLVGRDGQVIKRYAPNDEPESLRKDIEAALAAKAS